MGGVLGYITDPEVRGGLDLRQVPEPGQAPDETIIEVQAYAANRGELNLLKQRPNGWMPGQDVAGLVAIAAPDGNGPAAGTRVVGIADGGGWSQRVNVPTYRVAAIPDNVAFDEAAPLGVAGLTALRALRTGGPLLGKRVLVTGASGGVGSFAIQLAKAGGAHVTGLVSGKLRNGFVLDLGADHVTSALDDASGRFDLILDGVGGPVLGECIKHLAPGGTIAAYGMASGQRTEVAFGDFRGATGGSLIGFFVYNTDLRTFGQDLGYMAQLIAEGKLKTPGIRHDWRKTLFALDLFNIHNVTGKIVLKVS